MEQNIHGRKWDTFHNGYFSSPAVLSLFLETLQRFMAEHPPEVVVDLGGGTGLLLSSLKDRGDLPSLLLVNLDCSPPQLAVAAQRGIACQRGSVAEFQRCDLAPAHHRFLFIMRSVLHYFGQQGLLPLLCHLRGQAREGELFVHQTACFEHQEEANCLNTLYQEMGTVKWYPTTEELRRSLTQSGWQICTELPAPPLRLTEVDLAKRYELDAKTLHRIRRLISARFGNLGHLLRLKPTKFEVDLHYRILVCRAGAEV
jgi:hypothetical protein